MQGGFEQGTAQMPPHLLGDKGREGVQQAQGNIEDARQRIRGACGLVCLPPSLFLLGDLHIPVGEIGPDELVDLPPGLAVLEGLEEPLHIPHQRLQARPDPRIGQSVVSPGRQATASWAVRRR